MGIVFLMHCLSKFVLFNTFNIIRNIYVNIPLSDENRMYSKLDSPGNGLNSMEPWPVSQWGLFPIHDRVKG